MSRPQGYAVPVPVECGPNVRRRWARIQPAQGSDDMFDGMASDTLSRYMPVAVNPCGLSGVIPQ